MPEATWPLADLCRRDLEATRGRIVTVAGALGQALGFADLEGILPAQPDALGGLMPSAELRRAEQVLLPSLDADRAKAGWSLFVEVASRISAQPLASDAGLPSEALQSLYALIDAVRDGLKSMTPTPATAAGGDSVELIGLRILHDHLRPFLAKWHPRLAAWEQSNQPEAEWPEAAECRRELAEVRARIAADVHRIGTLAGVQNVDQMIATGVGAGP